MSILGDWRIFRKHGDQLPDNFGVSWVSGVYGPETIAHVQGAWQLYEHSGNTTFLQQAYTFYKHLFWDGIGGRHWLYAYDSGGNNGDKTMIFLYHLHSALSEQDGGCAGLPRGRGALE